MAVRIASAIVEYLLTEYNDTGDPIAEFKSQPVRVFRVVHPDIWAHGDAQAFPKAEPTSTPMSAPVPDAIPATVGD